MSSPENQQPQIPGLEEQPIAQDRNHAERGREIAGDAAERVTGAFSSMRDKFKGFTSAVKERSATLATKGVNLLFAGLGAGEYYTQRGAEKSQEIVKNTIKVANEIPRKYEAAKNSFREGRDATLQSWGDSFAMRKMQGEMQKLDKQIPFQSEDQIAQSEKNQMDAAWESYNRKLESIKGYHEPFRQQIAKKKELLGRIDAMIAKKRAAAEAAPEQATPVAA